MLMVRNRRMLLSICVSVLGLFALYSIFKDVGLALTSKAVIREKNADSNTMTNVAQVAVEDTSNGKGNSDATIKDDLKLKDSIMPSMPDAESKKALGNASWKYFHTLLARFPDEPTIDERAKLKNFIQLYAELYPCGECSYHFVKMIEKYPVQTSNRKAAALWGCDIHNKVNAYLKKEIYDCSTILEDYDCGCGDDSNN